MSRPSTLVPLNEMSNFLLSQLITIIIIMLSNHGGFMVLRSALGKGGGFAIALKEMAYLAGAGAA